MNWTTASARRRPSVENLLDYAVLKALAEKLLVASVDHRGDQVAIKFYEDTPLGPEKLVKLIRKRKGMRLDPSGVLWFEWKGEKGWPDGSHQKRIATTTSVELKFKFEWTPMKNCNCVFRVRFRRIHRAWLGLAVADALRRQRPSEGNGRSKKSSRA